MGRASTEEEGRFFLNKGRFEQTSRENSPHEASELEKGRPSSGGYLELNRDTSVRDSRKLAATQKSLPAVTATSD